MSAEVQAFLDVVEASGELDLFTATIQELDVVRTNAKVPMHDVSAVWREMRMRSISCAGFLNYHRQSFDVFGSFTETSLKQVMEERAAKKKLEPPPPPVDPPPLDDGAEEPGID